MLFCFNELNMNIFDADRLLDLSLRFGLNFVIISILVRFIYFKYSPNREFAFTYFIFNILIFLICYLMSGIDLNMGFGFGLFAMLGILRYRTITLSIKEMTYLLAVIVVAILNAISTNKITFLEILIMNFVIVAAIYLMERRWYVVGEVYQTVKYERIELIKPESTADLLQDIKERTGLECHRYEIEEIDLLTDSAVIKVFYLSPSKKNASGPHS